MCKNDQCDIAFVGFAEREFLSEHPPTTPLTHTTSKTTTPQTLKRCVRYKQFHNHCIASLLAPTQGYWHERNNAYVQSWHRARDAVLRKRMALKMQRSSEATRQEMQQMLNAMKEEQKAAYNNASGIDCKRKVSLFEQPQEDTPS